MATHNDFRKIIDQTKILRFPKYKLSTFGSSEIEYHLVSILRETPPLTHVRTGLVLSERPQIITRDSFKAKFQGFGKDAHEFEKWLSEAYGDSFRTLQYRFDNKPKSLASHRTAALVIAEQIRKDLDSRDAGRSAVIHGPERGWQVSLMKFIVEETLRSVQTNVTELEERGMFDPYLSEMNRRRRDILKLFQRARQDRSHVKELGKKLHEYGLFSEYEDQFFNLVNED
ncbi:MAG TPA: hypothetical protein PK876_06785 [Elusimicrobiota bacterium]|nr:hypothetical protein [Elusimicrobiota bacterium]